MKTTSLSLSSVFLLSGCFGYGVYEDPTVAEIVPEVRAAYEFSSYELGSDDDYLPEDDISDEELDRLFGGDYAQDYEGYARFSVLDDQRVLQSLQLNVVPTKTAKQNTGETISLVLQDPVIVANGPEIEVNANFLVTTPSLLESNNEPIYANATLTFTPVSVGSVSDIGTYSMTMGLSPTNTPISYPGLIIFFDIKSKTTLTEKWPKLDDAMKDRIATLTRRQHFKKLLKEIRKWLKEKGVKYDDVNTYFDPNGTSGEGITTSTPRETAINFGRGTFTSPGKFYSALMHELKHAKQFKENPIKPYRERELEAWLQECENLTRTGLRNDRMQMAQIKSKLKVFYKRTKDGTPKPAYMKSYAKRYVACLRRIKKYSQ